MSILKSSSRGALAGCALAVVLALGGCATPADRSAMAPTMKTSSKHFSRTLSITTQGGSETSALGSSQVSNEDLGAAIEKSITDARLFKEVVKGAQGDYELKVWIVSIKKPGWGASFTVDMETSWTLTRTSDGAVLLRRSIPSTFTAHISDALIGVARLKLALEGAARNNIETGLQAIAALDL